MKARRVAAVWLPGFTLQVAAQGDPSLKTQPVAITDGTVVLARNRLAVTAGVAVGMRVVEAVTHTADLLLVPYDPQGVQMVWDAVLDHLNHLGPVVEDAGLGEAFVDLSGVRANERLMVRRHLHALATLLDLTARIGVADGPFVASIAARRAREADGGVAIVPPGRGMAYLSPQPLTLLPFPERTRAALDLLGIRTIGQFAALRPSDIGQRFGRLGIDALLLAHGQDDRPLVPRPRERHETLVRAFDPPLDNLTAVIFAAKALLDGHASGLRRAGLVAQGVRLMLTVEGRDAVTIEQRWGAAAIPGAAELDALRLALEAAVVGEGTEGMEPPRVADIAVTLLDCAPDPGIQLPLTGASAVLRRQAVARFLTRVRPVLGENGVVEAAPVPTHLPDSGWESRPYDPTRVGTPPDEGEPPASSLLPAIPGFLVCRPPEPLAVTSERDILVALESAGVRQDVLAAVGPYVAEGGWWQEGGIARRYWLVLTADETLHLIARDARTEQWARYGLFD